MSREPNEREREIARSALRLDGRSSVDTIARALAAYGEARYKEGVSAGQLSIIDEIENLYENPDSAIKIREEARAQGYADGWRAAAEAILSRLCYGGHNHWDRTGQHGAGCETCEAQRRNREEVEALRDHPGGQAG